MRYFLILGVLIFVFAIFFSNTFTLAQVGTGGDIVPKDEIGTGGDQNKKPDGFSAPILPNPLKADNICELLKNIVGFMIWIAAPIAVGMILYGAYQMMFSGGEAEKFKNGAKTIRNTVIAYAIIIIGWGFVYVISEVLGTQGSLVC